MTWQVVGCSTCSGIWLVEDLRTTDTTECPHCFTQHQTDALRVRFEHDSHGVAAEIRARILAERAGKLDAYDNEGSWLDQARRVEDQFADPQSGYLADRADRVFEDHYQRFGELVEDSLDQWSERSEFLHDEAMDALGEIHSRFEAEAERTFEDLDTRFCDLVSLDADYGDVDHDDPETLGTPGGLSLTRQSRFAPAVDTTLDKPLDDLSSVVADGLRDDLVDAIRDLADGRTPLELQTLLDSANLTTSHDDADLLGLADRIARGSQQAAWEFARILATPSGRASTADHHLIPRLFDLVDATPTVVFRLDDAFLVDHGSNDDVLRRSQRESVCRFLSALARGCDVHVAGTGLEQLALYRDHREDLPVSREDITPLSESQSDRVARAKEVLDPDGREVQILRWLNHEDSQTLSYGALDSRLTVSSQRRSHYLHDDETGLVSLGLTDTFGPHARKHVELLPAGEQYLDWLDEETARQRTLQESVSDVSEPSDDSREDTRTHVRGEDGARPRHRLPALHTVQPLPRWDAQATAASPPENGLAVVNYPLEEQQDRGSPRWYYDFDADHLVVGAEFDGPMQYWVCVARALASRRTFAAILDDGDRLDDTDFGELLVDHKAVLRDSLCLGHLPDRIEDGADFLDELAEAERHLCELTKDLVYGEFENVTESEFRATVTQEALGLAKTMWDILTEVGVDVTLQVRLPEQNGGRHDVLKKERRHTLVQSLVTGVKLQARIGRSSVYRQLFETDDDRREAAIKPAVDAFDVAEMVGQLCVVGDLGNVETDLVQELRGRLHGLDEDIHDDAPDIPVRVPVRSTADLDRTAFARSVERMCAGKTLRPTREAVSTLRLFTATPFDAARSVAALQSEDEDDERDIRLSEVRYGLATLDADRIMPWESRGAREIVSTLLAADQPLSVSELVDHGEFGRSTWYDYRDWLVGLCVVVETDRGYRLNFPFHTDAERHSERRPWFVRMDDQSDMQFCVALRSLGYQFATKLLSESERGDVMEELSRGWAVDPDVVIDRWPRIECWLPVLRDVTERPVDQPDPVVVGQRGQARLSVAENGGVSA